MKPAPASRLRGAIPSSPVQPWLLRTCLTHGSSFAPSWRTLVQVPAFGRSWPPTLNPPRIGPTEFQDPSSNCLIRDVETTLGKQVLNVPIAQRETAIQPDGMLDDDRRKAVTTVRYLAHSETLKHRPCRSHGVNVTMPFEPFSRTCFELRHQMTPFEVYLALQHIDSPCPTIARKLAGVQPESSLDRFREHGLEILDAKRNR